MTVSAEGGGVSLAETMEFLAGRGITRLLVEGGPTVWRHFAEAGLRRRGRHVPRWQAGGSARPDGAVA